MGKFKPNAFGLCDMHGNVWQWCADSYGKDYYEKSPGQDPQGPDDSDDCVIRGGSFDDEAKDCRAAYRNRAEVSDWDVDLGFRVVCVP